MGIVRKGDSWQRADLDPYVFNASLFYFVDHTQQCAGITSDLCSGITSSGASGTMWDIGGCNLGSLHVGKQATQYTISPAPNSSTILIF